MTRIIGGAAGSLRLRVPPSGTRPTSDRVREAVFSALDARDVVAGARVLDLYAGSGALGLEAASRGASSVTLVERGSGAARVARENAAALRRALGTASSESASTASPASAAPVVTVVVAPVAAFLSGPRASGGTHGSRAEWDLVFIDPPYELDGAALAATLTALVPRLAADAVVVVERSARDPDPLWPDGLELDRRRDYGETAVFWATATGTAIPAKAAESAESAESAENE